MKKIIIVLTISFMALAGFAFVYFIPKDTIELNCTATLIHYENREDLFSHTSQLNIHFKKDGFGYMLINGNVYNKENRYILSRSTQFKYKRQTKHDSYYTVTVLSERKSGLDNVPDELTQTYMSFIVPGTERFLKLDYLPNDDVLFTTILGPFFVCDI